VGEVAVHEDQELDAVLESMSPPGGVGASETFLAGSMQYLDRGALFGETVGELPRAVRRRVVDDEHMDVEAPERVLERVDHRLEIVPFVVRREADDRSPPHATILPRSGPESMKRKRKRRAAPGQRP
jgi:hypothetical protein